MNLFGINLSREKKVGKKNFTFRSATTGLSRQDLSFADFFKNWSGTCVIKRATKVGSVNNYIVDKKGEAVEDTWLNELLLEPNPVFNSTFSEIKELIVKWLDYTGNAIVYTPITEGSKVPAQMWVMPSDNRMQIIVDGLEITEYRILTPSGYKSLDPAEVCHIKTLNPSIDWKKNFYIGSPIAMMAAIDAIETDLDIKKFLRDSFEADTIAPLVLSNPQEFESQEQIAQLKKSIKDQNLNRKIAAALENGMTLDPIPTTGIGSQAIADSLKKQTNAILIAAAFGVPFGLLDTTSQQNVATAQENKNTFLTDTIDPLLKRIERSLTQHFSKWNDGLAIVHDEFVIENQKLELERQRIFLDYGIKTRNEVRIENGYDIIEGGDEPLVPSNLTTWNNAKEPETKKKSIKNWDGMSEEDKVKYWKTINDIVTPFEKQIYTGANYSIISMGDELIAHLKNNHKSIKSGTVLAVFDEFDFDRFHKIIADNTEAGVSGLIQTMVNHTNRTYGGGNTDYSTAISRAVKESTNKITPSIDVIRDGLRDDLIKTISENPYADIEDLYKIIEDDFSREFYGDANTEGLGIARARMIAQTTATYSTGSAQLIVFKELGLNKRWVTQRDGKVRPTHRKADGQKPDAKGFFHIGTDKMKQPAGGKEADENVNCRCYLFAE